MSTDPSHESADSSASAGSPGAAEAAPHGSHGERSAAGHAGGSSSQGGSQAAPQGGGPGPGWGTGQDGSQAAHQPQWGQRAQNEEQAERGEQTQRGQVPPYGQAPQYGQRDQGFAPSPDGPHAQPGQQPGTGHPHPQYAQNYQYPQYQQGGPSYGPGGAYGAAARPKSGMKKTGAIFAIVGGVVLILSLVSGFIMFGTSVAKVVEQQEKGTEIHGVGTVHLEADRTYAAYSSEGATTPSCTISGSGSVETTEDRNDDLDYSAGDQWVSFDSIVASKTGDYQVACDSDATILIAEPLEAGTLATAGIGMLILFGGGSLGFILLVLGLILFFVGRSRQRAMMQQAW